MTEQEWLTSADPQAMLQYIEGMVSERKLRLFVCGCCKRVWHRLLEPCFREAVQVSERFADGKATDVELREAAEAASVAVRRLTNLDETSPTREALRTSTNVDSGSSEEPMHEDELPDWNEDTFSIAVRSADVACLSCFDPNDEGIPYSSRASRLVVEAAGYMATEVAGKTWETEESYLQEQRSGQEVERGNQANLLRDIVGNPFRPVAPKLVWLTNTVTTMAHAIYEERQFGNLPILADALEDAGCTDPAILTHCRGPGPHVPGCWVVDMILEKK